MVHLDEIGEFADLVNLHRLRTSADLAAYHQESEDQFLLVGRVADQLALCRSLHAVGEDRALLPP